MATQHWPDGISDGLVTPCSFCNTVPAWDYTVDDEIWKKVVPPEFRRYVICLSCLDRLAIQHGIDAIGIRLLRVQFCGQKHTAVLNVTEVFKHEPAAHHGEGECKANAKLIAAAPDLLKACKTLVDWYEVNSTELKRDDAFKAAKAAIKKAMP